MALTSGTKLGPYEIVAPVGAGGMGEVYRSRDARLNRDVAIKVLPAGFARDPERLRRFQQEAQAAAALNHPSILAVHDFGEHEGSPYIVTEFLDGETLRERLRPGALPVRKATECAEHVARGLAAAHDKGIVHRDLKPENIFVTRDGRVKILDFGLAKLTRPEGTVPSDTATLASQTEPGVVMGTVGYMSPEQVKGQNADHRSDLFSFGAILYEMLSGKRAFHGDTSVETMSAILKQDPPELTETNRTVPPALERIVRHCLEKNPGERFQSARDLAFDLQSLSGSSSQLPALGIAAQSSARPWLGLPVIASFVVAVLAAVFWAGWLLKPVSSPSFKQLTFRRGTVTAARFAPDGQNVIYSATWEDSPHPALFSARIDSVLSRPLDISDADVLAISPQGEMALLQRWRRTIGWERSGMLARMALSGGASRESLDGVQDADWSSDGTSLAVIRRGTQSQLEFPLGHLLVSEPSGGWLSDLRVAPDQQHIAYFEHPSRGDDRGSVCVVDRNGSKHTLSAGWSSLKGLAWSASGGEIWFTGSNTGGNRALYALNLSGRLRPILRVPGLLLYDIGRDGRVLLAVESIRREIMGLTPGNSQERNLTWLDWSRERSLTPDGRWLLFDEQSDGGGVNYSIYVRQTDGSPAIRLGDNDASSISDDGKWVLATTTAEGGSLLLMPTGAGEARPIKTGNLQDPWAVFLPDQKRILVASSDGRMYVQSLESDTPRPVSPPGIIGFSWAFTADGKYVLARDQQQKWALYPIEGGQPMPLPKWTAGDFPIGHTTDNHSFFVRNGDLPANIYRFDFVSGTRQFMRQLRPADSTGMERIGDILMTPDGKYYVYGGTRDLSNLFVVSGLK
jgi:eukaryotic-like serine/threonine-protein kinase